MKGLRANKSPRMSLCNNLNWASLVDDGVVLCKSGAFLAGYVFKGADIASMTGSERNYILGRMNAALARFDNGWAIWMDATRLATENYSPPHKSHFPDPISSLIEEERRKSFEKQDTHFQTEYALILSYTPPIRLKTKLNDLVWEKKEKNQQDVTGQTIEYFNKSLEDFEDSLASVLVLRRMRSYENQINGQSILKDELVNYLNFCLTGNSTEINLSPCAMYLDSYLGKDFWTGDTPRIDNKYVCCISITGFPDVSWPNILSSLETMPFAYRWSTRFIYLDSIEALKEIRTVEKKWKLKVRGLISALFNKETGRINRDALSMVQQTEEATTDVQSDRTRFGFYSSVFSLMGEDREFLLSTARELVKELRALGFEGRIETINAVEAWFGSLPGHAVSNLRRPLASTLNLACVLPLSSLWAGAHYNPSPLFPDKSPPLMYCSTQGSTPFRFNLHVGDLGHTLIFGPTGAGKSVLLNILAAQFRRYRGKGGEEASITAFDKGRSMKTLVKACGGTFIDIGAEGTSLQLSPLQRLDTVSDITWASEWIETCFELQSKQSPTPAQRGEIYRALTLLKGANDRSLTSFCSQIQNQEVKESLKNYTLSGSLGYLIDSQNEGLKESAFTVFEIETLMGLGEKNLIPILLYLFRRFELSLKGQPALLILDEAWLMLGHPVFREKIREWLKVLRKSNCAVVLATQSLSDAARSGIFDVLIESCPTKILLPNEEADKSGTSDYPGPCDLYTMMGLNQMEISLLKNAVKKKHYYYTSPEGKRVFELALGPKALSFVGVSDKETLAHLDKLEKKHGEQWPFKWLEERGLAGCESQ